MFMSSTVVAKDLWRNTTNKNHKTLSGCEITLREFCFLLQDMICIIFLSYVYACYARCTKKQGVFSNMIIVEFGKTVLILFALLNYNKYV